MFDAETQLLDNGRVRRFCLTRRGEAFSYDEALSLWENDADFRSFFISLLTDVPFSAFRWETPPVTAGTLSREFEFVILESAWLDMPPEPAPFAEYFTDADEDHGIVVFENLGRDAVLIVPSPRGPVSAYGHLAAFARLASPAQNHALWRVVGRTMRERVADQPVWLSTAGGGVAWLHVRLDSRPKYYGFTPYKKSP